MVSNDRLYESYRRLQKTNAGLEDKLLRVVDKFEGNKITWLILSIESIWMYVHGVLGQALGQKQNTKRMTGISISLLAFFLLIKNQGLKRCKENMEMKYG